MIWNLARKKVSGGLPPQAALESMSWEQIDAVAQAGRAAEYWSVGETKTVPIGGVNYTVAILDFAHDALANGAGNAAVTFGLVDCLNTKYALNSVMSNRGGWESCTFRTTLQETIFAQLPDALRSAIKPVRKDVADVLTPELYQVTDTLFLFSEPEVLGTYEYAYVDEATEEMEGSQYPYFATESKRIKKVNGTAGIWWTRSPMDWSDDYYCVMNAQGRPSYVVPTHTLGVSFGFCV